MKMNPLIRFAALAIFAMLLQVAYASDEVRTVQGESVYFGNGDQSRNECKRLALEAARNDALAKSFGTKVSTNITSRITRNNDLESSYEDFLSQTEVDGIWIADIGEPVYEISTDEDGNFVVKCKVKGKARGVDNQSVDFSAFVLKNSSNGQQSEQHFANRDFLYVPIKVPTDGYVAVYLVDDRQNVYTLFPYLSENATAVKIKRDHKYVLFDRNSPQPTDAEVDEIYLCTDRQIERNDLYIVYSPNFFNKANDKDMGTESPRQLGLKEFNRWLINVRQHDPKMNVKRFPVEITNSSN